jgi:general secretion pathway protein C
MATYLSWGANAALFVLGCFLAANTANALLGSMLTAPTPASAEAPAPPTANGRSWDERKAILDRNLFQSATSAVALPDEIADNLEKTRLPLTLLGTAASTDPHLAWAAVEDKEKRETLVVGVGYEIRDNASVQRIERRRLVLLENGSPRELTLDEDESGKPGRPQPPSLPRLARTRRAAPEPRVRQLSDNRFAVPRDDAEAALRNPANLFSQARILPKYADGQMVGVQINAIKSGSLFEQLGLKNGDVITELNGIAIDSPEASAKLLQEFTQANSLDLVLEDGETKHVDLGD